MDIPNSALSQSSRQSRSSCFLLAFRSIGIFGQPVEHISILTCFRNTVSVSPIRQISLYGILARYVRYKKHPDTRKVYLFLVIYSLGKVSDPLLLAVSGLLIPAPGFIHWSNYLVVNKAVK